MRLTFVKKLLADGSPCQKCRDVEARLRDGGYWDRLDAVTIADERDPDSAGMRLAAQLNVDRAPFFVVEREDSTTVYTVYLKFLKEVLDAPVDSRAESQALLESHPELDFL